MDHLLPQLFASLIAAQLLQFLKKADWFALLKQETPESVQRIWGFLAATITAAGIHFATEGTFMDSQGLTITITGVSFNAVKDIAIAWSSQQAFYDWLLRAKTVVPSETMQQQFADSIKKALTGG